MTTTAAQRLPWSNWRRPAECPSSAHRRCDQGRADLERRCDDLIEQLGDAEARIACRNALQARISELVRERDAARAVLRRATTDSIVTTSDEPGCFFCDRADGCAPDCEAKAALGEA